MNRDDVTRILQDFFKTDKLLELNNRNLAHKLSNPCLSMEDALRHFEISERKRISICSKRNILGQFLNSLNSKQRILVLNYIRDVHIKDIALILNISERELYRRLAVIKNKLNKYLNSYCGGNF